ncbi:MAG TPA: hypothetical protein PKV20_02580 [Anaerolineae bacterium]|nr:hypothetical protein [Anaerolineae bacterium]
MYTSDAHELTTDELTAHLPLEWRINDAYFELAYQSVLPALEALTAGNQNPEALLSVTFGPVAQIVLTCLMPEGVWNILDLLRSLIGPPDAAASTEFSTASRLLKSRRSRGRMAVFDLRPGGNAEFRGYPYAPLYDRRGRISTFHAEALPLVAAVVRGWGMTTVVIHQQPTPLLPLPTVQAQAQAQWAFLTQR